MDWVAGCSWNDRPDERGLGGRMEWDTQLIKSQAVIEELLTYATAVQ